MARKSELEKYTNFEKKKILTKAGNAHNFLIKKCLFEYIKNYSKILVEAKVRQNSILNIMNINCYNLLWIWLNPLTTNVPII